MTTFPQLCVFILFIFAPTGLRGLSTMHIGLLRGLSTVHYIGFLRGLSTVHIGLLRGLSTVHIGLLRGLSTVHIGLIRGLSTVHIGLLRGLSTVHICLLRGLSTVHIGLLRGLLTMHIGLWLTNTFQSILSDYLKVWNQCESHILTLWQVKLIRKVSDHWWVIKTNLGAQGEVPAKQLDFYRENIETGQSNVINSVKFTNFRSQSPTFPAFYKAHSPVVLLLLFSVYYL